METNDFYRWQVELFAVEAYGAPLDVNTFNMFFDSGSSLNYIPTFDFEILMNEI